MDAGARCSFADKALHYLQLAHTVWIRWRVASGCDAVFVPLRYRNRMRSGELRQYRRYVCVDKPLAEKST